MKKLGLIGQNIQASRSPSLHTMLGELDNTPVSYELQELDAPTKDVFVERLEEIQAKGFSGTNVTFPFKQIAMESADECNEAVRLTGATNTLLLQDNKVFAFNTDYTGFIRGYRARVGEQAAGKVLLIGAGGVGRAVAFALFEVGAIEVLVADQNADGAQSLVDALISAGRAASVVPMADLASAAHGVDGLVNCTPVGHYTLPGNPLPAEAFGGQGWAFDAVYTPLDTEFLVASHQAGLKIVTGFDLFFYQGLDAYEIFTGQKVANPQPVWDAFCDKYEIESQLI